MSVWASRGKCRVTAWLQRNSFIHMTVQNTHFTLSSWFRRLCDLSFKFYFDSMMFYKSLVQFIFMLIALLLLCGTLWHLALKSLSDTCIKTWHWNIKRIQHLPLFYAALLSVKAKLSLKCNLGSFCECAWVKRSCKKQKYDERATFQIYHIFVLWVSGSATGKYCVSIKIKVSLSKCESELR